MLLTIRGHAGYFRTKTVRLLLEDFKNKIIHACWIKDLSFARRKFHFNSSFHRIWRHIGNGQCS